MRWSTAPNASRAFRIYTITCTHPVMIDSHTRWISSLGPAKVTTPTSARTAETALPVDRVRNGGLRPRSAARRRASRSLRRNATSMFVSVNTVRTHIGSILRKLAVPDAASPSVVPANFSWCDAALAMRLLVVQPEFVASGNRLTAGRDSELLVDRLCVRLDSVERDEQAVADLSERKVGRQQWQNPQLCCRERRRPEGDLADPGEFQLQVFGCFDEYAKVRPLLDDLVSLPEHGRGAPRVPERDVTTGQFEKRLHGHCRQGVREQRSQPNGTP
jgi:hypothetical protein